MKIIKGKNTEKKKQTNKNTHKKNSLFKRFRHSFAQGIYGVVAF